MSNWSRRNVFITGANGFVGSWLARELVEQGANVVVLVRDLTPRSGLALHPGLPERLTQVRGDLLDYALMQRILTEFDIDTVFHLAAQAIVAVANRSPLSTFESNVRGTWQLLEACRLSPLVKRVVVASSDKAYGDQAVLPANTCVTLGVPPGPEMLPVTSSRGSLYSECRDDQSVCAALVAVFRSTSVAKLRPAIFSRRTKSVTLKSKYPSVPLLTLTVPRARVLAGGRLLNVIVFSPHPEAETPKTEVDTAGPPPLSRPNTRSRTLERRAGSREEMSNLM